MRRILGFVCAGFAAAFVCGLIMLGCASVRKVPNEVQSSVDTDLPRDRNGQIDSAQLDQQLQRLPRTKSHSAKRPCKGATTNCLVDLSISELEESWRIDPAKGPGRRRWIGVWTNNDSKDSEGSYDLAPGQTYYVWVADAPSYSASLDSRTIWGIMRLGHSSIVEGYVIRCHSDHSSNNQRSQLDFYYCPSSPTKDLGYRTASISSPLRTFATFAAFSTRLSDGAASLTAAGETWFECDPGCCTGTRALQ
jgi:hypothetical protein